MILSLKSTFVLGLSFMLLGAMVVFGLKITALTEETGGGGIMVEATKDPLKLTMILNKTTFKLSDTAKYVEIFFSVENVGNRTLNMSLYEDDFNYIVYDEAGSEVFVFNNNWGHPTEYIPTQLPPSLSRQDSLPWYEYKIVSPGRYQIVGQFVSSHLRMTVETPSVTVTILP